MIKGGRPLMLDDKPVGIAGIVIAGTLPRQKGTDLIIRNNLLI